MPLTSELAPQQLLEEAYKVLARDKARIGNVGYPAYRGSTVAPMSSLTQKAREYQERFGAKRAPYSRKIDTALNKREEGLSPAAIQGLLGNIRQSQESASQNTLLSALRNQFNSSYTPERQAAFNARSGQAVGRGIDEFGSRLQDISRASGNLEGTKNDQLARTLQALSQDKQTRRKALVTNLEQFGNQKHAHQNKVIESNQARFRQEAEEPQRRLEMLAQALEPHRRNYEGGNTPHPDLEKPMAQQVLSALRAYGIDPSKPTEQWEGSRTTSPQYSGKTVANLTPEMETSYRLLEQINPSIKDTYHGQRKQIIRDLLTNETTAGKAAQQVPESMRPRVAQLDEEARQRIQKDLGAINNRYIKLGQYGSEQHMSEAERRAEEINKAMLEQRQRMLEESLKSKIGMQHEEEVNKLRKLNTLGSAGHKEFADVIHDVRDINKLGATKWQNEQDDLEQLYKNYQNEKLWEWPHMRNKVRGEAHDEIFGNAAARGLQLDEIANLRSRYSEVEKERNALQANIKSTQDYYTNRLAQMNQLEQARVAREQELANQRAAQERAQREAADRAAREQAERNRLAALQANIYKAPPPPPPEIMYNIPYSQMAFMGISPVDYGMNMHSPGFQAIPQHRLRSIMQTTGFSNTRNNIANLLATLPNGGNTW